jgi:glycosyltransferase involved in cell wall biosynthesis
MDSTMSKPDLCVVHVFPYSPTLSGGHSNAIRGFIACQRAKRITAGGVAPQPDSEVAQSNWEFPLAEVDSLWDLRWAAIAKRFSIAPDSSLLQFYSVNTRFAPLLNDLRRAGIPYVLNSQGQLNFHGVAHWFKKFVYLNFVNRGPRKAAGLHVLTAVADRRLNLLMPGYRGLRLVQGNLVQVPNLAESRAGSRSDYGIPQDAFLVLFLGRLDVWVKGLDVLVEAFSCLPADRFRLLLVGPDWENGKAKLQQLSTRFGCRDRVHFLGPLYGEKKWSVLRMADLFVSPSRWEAFSIAQAEAMAVGLPVVTSNQVALAPDLREADAACVVPFSAEPLTRAIASLEADPERRRALSARAKAWSGKTCDPDRAGARFREFYEAILDKTQGAGE